MNNRDILFYVGELIGFINGVVTNVTYQVVYGFYFGLAKSRGFSNEEADEFAHNIAAEKITRE